MARRVALALLLIVAACGRIGFDPMSAGGDGGIGADAVPCPGCDATACAKQPAVAELSRADTGSASPTSLDIPAPAGLSTGDLVLIVATVDEHNLSPMGPPGFTEITMAADSSRQVSVYFEVAGPNLPASFTFSWSSGDQAIAYALRITGADPAGPIGANGSTFANSEPATFPPLATTVDDALVIGAVTTPLNVSVCGAAEWNRPFVGLDCFFNNPNNNATVATASFATAGTDVAPIYNFSDPPDNHASALIEIVPDADNCP